MSSPYGCRMRCAFPLLMALLVVPGSAQVMSVIDPGFVSNLHALPAPPAFISLVEFTGAGDLLVFDGTALVRFDQTGAPVVLFTPPAGSFGEVLEIEPGGLTVLFATSGAAYELHRVDVASGAATPLPGIDYLYDLAFDGGGGLWASIGDASFSGTTLEKLDPVTFARQVGAQLQGASGPLAVRPSGDVLYGTNDFLAPGQAILELDAALLAAALTGTPLTEASATVLASGLDGLTSFALDGDGDLYFTENDFFAGSSRVGRLDPMLGVTTFVLAGAGFHLARQAFEVPSSSFAPGAGPGAPRLAVVCSDFATANRLALIEPSMAGGRVFGDCNRSGFPSISDALLASLDDLGLVVLAGVDRAQCEVNGDASLDVLDALLIAQSSAGLGTVLGY